MNVRKVVVAAPRWAGPWWVLALTLAAANTILAGGCATVQVGSDYDRSANFANYHTVALMKREHHGTNAATNPLVVQRADDAIKAELQRKGYQLTTDPAAADFIVDFTIGSQERTDINSYPDPFVGPGWGWGRRGWWGGPYGVRTSTCANTARGLCRSIFSMRTAIARYGTVGPRRSSAAATSNTPKSRSARRWIPCWPDFRLPLPEDIGHGVGSEHAHPSL